MVTGTKAEKGGITMSKKRWTRYIAFILTALMLISAVPVGAKADTDKPEEAISEEAAATSDGANVPASSTGGIRRDR